ncbi:response regulator transcription factor [Bradyrhizobium sp. USDA 10063]
MPNAQRLRLSGESVFFPWRLRAFARASLHPVTGPFLAIVDDDEALCSALVDLMRSVGYRAEPYASAETFLASPNLFSLDCIVADIHMPGMSGLQLARSLQEGGITTPVILITALPDQRLDDEAMAVGAYGLFRKPFETSAFLDCIARSLSK